MRLLVGVISCSLALLLSGCNDSSIKKQITADLNGMYNVPCTQGRKTISEACGYTSISEVVDGPEQRGFRGLYKEVHFKGSVTGNIPLYREIFTPGLLAAYGVSEHELGKDVVFIVKYEPKQLLVEGVCGFDKVNPEPGKEGVWKIGRVTGHFDDCIITVGSYYVYSKIDGESPKVLKVQVLDNLMNSDRSTKVGCTFSSRCPPNTFVIPSPEADAFFTKIINARQRK